MALAQASGDQKRAVIHKPERQLLGTKPWLEILAAQHEVSNEDAGYFTERTPLKATPAVARPSRSVALFAGLVVLITTAPFILALAPVATCPNCLGTGRVDGDTDMWWHFLEHGPEAPVPTKIMDHLTVTCDR